jgi:hypothetical protein
VLLGFYYYVNFQGGVVMTLLEIETAARGATPKMPERIWAGQDHDCQRNFWYMSSDCGVDRRGELYHADHRVQNLVAALTYIESLVVKTGAGELADRAVMCVCMREAAKAALTEFSTPTHKE